MGVVRSKKVAVIHRSQPSPSSRIRFSIYNPRQDIRTNILTWFRIMYSMASRNCVIAPKMTIVAAYMQKKKCTVTYPILDLNSKMESTSPGVSHRRCIRRRRSTDVLEELISFACDCVIDETARRDVDFSPPPRKQRRPVICERMVFHERAVSHR